MIRKEVRRMEQYEAPKTDMILFDADDVIVTSGDIGEGGGMD